MTTAPTPAAAPGESSPAASPALQRLADLTTLRVGGAPRRCVVAETEAQLVDAVRAADDAGERVLLVGGGSNLLVGDDPLDATVVLVRTRGVELLSQDACGGGELRVAAGEDWDAVVAVAVRRGLSGMEALSGIPGSTGATPVQNVGAYGQEVADTIATVRTWDRVARRVTTLASADCAFGYRTSRFKAEPDRFVVLTVTFSLRASPHSAPVRYPELARALGVPVGSRAPLAAVRDAVLALRAGKGMVLDGEDPDTSSAGSFFTNPVLDAVAAGLLPAGAPRWDTADGRTKTSAAWLVEHAGFERGFGLPGPASLSTKHCLALTNRGSARADDLVALARQVRDGVRSTFGVELEAEPTLVGCSL